MGFFNIHGKEDIIEAQKKISAELRRIRETSKPEKCILCGRNQTSYCNSHSVPAMVLRNIADGGKVLQSNRLVDFEILELEKGVNNSGTFHFICRECDSKYFQDYEDESKLSQKPSDKMLAEIALKNSLLMLSKRTQEHELYRTLQSEYPQRAHFEDMFDVQSLDKRDYLEEVELYKEIIDKNLCSCFHVLFWKVLPHRIPIATQSEIALHFDLEGNEINEIYNLSPDIRIQSMHLCLFPLNECSIILAFYHRRDKGYRGLRHQINSMSESEILEYLNYLVFAYTENYYLYKGIEEVIINDEKLQELSREYDMNPDLGLVSEQNISKHMTYKAISRNEIPNFLLDKYAISPR